MLKITSFQQPLVVVLGLVLAAFSTAKPAQSAIFTYEDDTTNQPTWRRTAPGNPPTLITGERDGNLGMTVHYSVFDFTVDQSGLYTISGLSQPTPPRTTPWDIFLVLYQDNFDPHQQLTNVLVASTTTTGVVEFSRQLTAQRKYSLVTTGRRVNDFGLFTNTIRGVGQIVPVPESDLKSAILVATCLGFLLRKRKGDLVASQSDHEENTILKQETLNRIETP
ncbi:MAG TPA: PEP-CTERM sorting domain-containing protein [Nostocaceae cyanobacterium]|nr:PEP-CTERM sorting domain-containing protein [Nostocaceae cyanobacterium]